MADEFEVHGSPEEVRSRLQEGLVQMHSLWFPSPREVDAWRQTEAGLYVRWTGSLTYEIGPRTLSLNAARLCPVWRGRLEEAGSGRTRISLQRGLPRSTEVLLASWVGLVALWGTLLGWQLSAGDEQAGGWLVWWGVTASFVLLGPLVGWVAGGQQLIAHRSWLAGIAGGTVPR